MWRGIGAVEPFRERERETQLPSSRPVAPRSGMETATELGPGEASMEPEVPLMSNTPQPADRWRVLISD